MSDLKAIEAILYVFKTEEGGRRTAFVSSYRPSFHFGDRQTDGAIYIKGRESVNPGESCEISAKLLHPEAIGDLLKPGAVFEIREGSKVIGRGIVTAGT